jgi:ribonucleoside-diphosphate reductase alpha chain
MNGGIPNGNPGTLLWITDIFLHQFREGSDRILFSSKDATGRPELYGDEFNRKHEELERSIGESEIFGKKVTCREIWQKITQPILEAEYPKIAFRDACNQEKRFTNGVTHRAELCWEHVGNTSYEKSCRVQYGSIVHE